MQGRPETVSRLLLAADRALSDVNPPLKSHLYSSEGLTSATSTSFHPGHLQDPPAKLEAETVPRSHSRFCSRPAHIASESRDQILKTVTEKNAALAYRLGCVACTAAPAVEMASTRFSFGIDQTATGTATITAGLYGRAVSSYRVDMEVGCPVHETRCQTYGFWIVTQRHHLPCGQSFDINPFQTTTTAANSVLEKEIWGRVLKGHIGTYLPPRHRLRNCYETASTVVGKLFGLTPV